MHGAWRDVILRGVPLPAFYPGIEEGDGGRHTSGVRRAFCMRAGGLRCVVVLPCLWSCCLPRIAVCGRGVEGVCNEGGRGKGEGGGLAHVWCLAFLDVGRAVLYHGSGRSSAHRRIVSASAGVRLAALGPDEGIKMKEIPSRAYVPRRPLPSPTHIQANTARPADQSRATSRLTGPALRARHDRPPVTRSGPRAPRSPL